MVGQQAMTDPPAAKRRRGAVACGSRRPYARRLRPPCLRVQVSSKAACTSYISSQVGRPANGQELLKAKADGVTAAPVFISSQRILHGGCVGTDGFGGRSYARGQHRV